MPNSQRTTEQKNAEDVLFDMFHTEGTELLSVGKFLAVSIYMSECVQCPQQLNLQFSLGPEYVRHPHDRSPNP